MGKASSPLRLQNELMEDAKVSGRLQHRSASEQIEYWADIGRKIEQVVDLVDIARIKAGLAKIKIEDVKKEPVSSEMVFSRLDALRVTGELEASITSGAIRYQASKKHPGMLEQVHPDGKIITGQFIDGEFRSV